jgi:deazaflavin-dependent oxidoreductase (nitroreductase family)
MLSKIFAWRGTLNLVRPIVTTVDRTLFRLTDGKVTLTRWSGQHGLVMLTVGARSGQIRPVPVQYVPDGADLLVVASNFAGPKDPAWAHNLRKNADIDVNINGRVLAVHATELEGGEREAAWRRVNEVWPYQNYQDQTERLIPVFRLTPVDR